MGLHKKTLIPFQKIEQITAAFDYARNDLHLRDSSNF